MQSDKTEEKTCESCEFFYQHYVKCTQRFMKTCCGHCVHKQGKKIFNKKNVSQCEFWEESKPEIKERRKSITETISWMSDCLNSMYLVLKDDDETEIT